MNELKTPSTIADALAGIQPQFADPLRARFDTIRAQYRALDPDHWQPAEAAKMHGLLAGLADAAAMLSLHGVARAARDLVGQLERIATSGKPPSDAMWHAIGKDLAALDRHVQDLPPHHADSTGQEPPPSPAAEPLVHVVEPDAEHAEQLAGALRAAGFRVRVFTEPGECRTRCCPGNPERPDAVVVSLVFPEGDEAGAALIAELDFRADAGTPSVVVSDRDDLPARLAALRAGASYYLTRSMDTLQLTEALDRLTGRQPEEPFRVLLVDDDPLLLQVMAEVLRSVGMAVDPLSRPLGVLEALDAFAPDLVILDIDMPDASGPELAAVLRQRSEWRDLPILFLCAEADAEQHVMAFNLGGDDILHKPVEPECLVAAAFVRARRAREASDMRKHLETTLYEREREHLALDQHAIVSIADRAGNITYVNDRFCQVSGYQRDELLGRNHRIIKSGAHPPAFYRQLWQTIAAGKVWQGEICNRRKDGSLYWVESTITPFMDSKGEPYQYVSIRTDISHVKAAEQELERHKERLRRGQLFANIGTWDWDVQTGDLFWSERIAPLFGYAEGELETSYENFLAAIHPDDRQAVVDAVENCVERNLPYEIEHRVVWPDGTVRWLLERGAVARDSDGTPLHMLGVVQDIDDRKRAELALAERERQLREAQSLAHIGDWQADLTTGTLTWSDEIYRIFGHQPGSFAPSVEAFQAAVHPDDRQLVLDSERRAEQSGRHDVVHRIVRPDGSVRHVHELAHAQTDPDGKLVRLRGTVQDITDRIEAERALQQSQDKLSGLFKLSPLGIALTDMDGHYLEFNEAFRAICGYPAEELQALDYWTLTPREYEAQEAAQLESLQKTGRYGPYEKVYRRKDGSLIPIRLNGMLVTGQDGQPQIWSIVEDITDSKQAEQALIVARDEAERANQAKSEFLSNMSHELRTPMNAILGFGQLLEYDGTLSEEQSDNVQEILKAGNHLLELINEVLDLAKVESGHIDLSLEPVDVCEVIADCLGLVAPLAEQRGIQISHHGQRGTAVRADRTRLKQALLNLLSNAIKYNRDGGQVTLDVEPVQPNALRLRVDDTGPGIPADRLGELFQPFNRLDAEHSTIEGTGIGLTITRRIVDMMGGSVGVDSRPGVGSSFWIELPAEAIDEPPDGPATTDGDEGVPTAEQAQHTVLYIEDSPTNLKLVAQLLGRRRHIHLLTAHTSELGIELALARRPELILLDINMPGMDGYQVLKVLHSAPDLKDVPVIAVTANAMPRDIERGKAAGFAEYLTKPIDVPTFMRTLDRHLNAGTQEDA